jgi:hypothetical protein
VLTAAGQALVADARRVGLLVHERSRIAPICSARTLAREPPEAGRSPSNNRDPILNNHVDIGELHRNVDVELFSEAGMSDSLLELVNDEPHRLPSLEVRPARGRV